MCNLYTVRKSAAEVAAHFGVAAPDMQFNAPDEVYPGRPGMVVRDNDGTRVLETMSWGWPLRLADMKPESKPKAVNNIADLRKRMWIGFAKKPKWRCLVPTTHFAEAEGPKGKMTRTWLHETDQPIFAWAGLWRDSAEWGPVYSCAMTNANETVKPIHNRMPVILHRNEWDAWLYGTFEDLCALQDRKYPDDLIGFDRTEEPWRRQSDAQPH